MTRLLAALAQKQAPPLEQLEIGEARRQYRLSCSGFGLPVVSLPSIEDRVTPDGHGIRIYRPVDGDADLPWILYLHGGGWVLGDLDTHDPVCRLLARDSGCCVIALDYPLAPEHPFPAGLDSAFAAIAWIRGNAASFHVDPERMAIGGDSAGACLAASCCLMLRDAGMPAPRLQLLFYPATDLAADTQSYRRVTSEVPLTAARMHWFLDRYIGSTGQRLDWRASPLRAPSLSHLPPAFIVTAGRDPLRDEGIAFAQRLEQEGTRVTHLHLADQIHGFLTLGRTLRRAAVVLQQAARELESSTA